MNKITIAIDGREANIVNRVGSNVYAYQILFYLEQLLRDNDQVSVVVLLATDPLSDMPSSREGWTYTVFGPQAFWTQWALPLHLFTHKQSYDIFFTPSHYAPRFCPVPYVSSVMDTAYLHFKDHFKKTDTLKLTEWTKYSVQNAKKVVTISNFTREEVIQQYGKDPHDVIVAYPDVSAPKVPFTSSDETKLLKKYALSEPYFLFVGTLQPRKNIETLVKAFEIFSRMQAARSLQAKKNKKREMSKTKLVLAGKVGWLSEPLMQRIANSPLKRRIVLTGFISEKEKQILYKNAAASCLVGLFEGFGIPALESLHAATVPIVSNTTSLPEVVGDAGLLADPTNPQEIANQMWTAYTLSSQQKRNFKKLAQAQIKKFDWKISAQTILDTLLLTCNESQR